MAGNDAAGAINAGQAGQAGLDNGSSQASLNQLKQILDQALADTTQAAIIQTPRKVAIGTINGAKQNG